MRSLLMRGTLFVLVASFLWFAGCRKSPDAAQPPAPATDAPAQPPPKPQPAAPPEVDESPEPGDQSLDESQAAEIRAAFASLTAQDRALAETQKICPVSGEPLGAMGTPVKVAVAGHEVLICCEHCKEALLEEPAKYLAKIGLTPSSEEAE